MDFFNIEIMNMSLGFMAFMTATVMVVLKSKKLQDKENNERMKFLDRELFYDPDSGLELL